MSPFLKVKTAAEVMSLLGRLEPLSAESVEVSEAYGRVPATPVFSPEPLPHFDRSLMDGYAVRARDTYGASETLPALLEVVGEVAMGQVSSLNVGPGRAVALPTGGMLPDGADAVVMVEYTHPLDEKTIEVTKPVAPGEHVLRIGEDIRLGQELFPARRCLRPQDVGMLAALGVTAVDVHRRPRVAILSTGDEILPASTRVLPTGKVRDINTFSIAGQVLEAGGLVGDREVIPDDLGLLVAACRSALIHHDVLLFSGGSSVGVRDYTLRILEHFPEVELLVHGIAIRPGKPTIMARLGNKVFWGIPGQPVSAMMIVRAFVAPCLSILQGALPTAPSTGNSRSAALTRQVPSVHGRTDYVPVALSQEGAGLSADPIFGASAMIGTLVRATGYIVIPEHVEGLNRGEVVDVFLF